MRAFHNSGHGCCAAICSTVPLVQWHILGEVRGDKGRDWGGCGWKPQQWHLPFTFCSWHLNPQALLFVILLKRWECHYTLHYCHPCRFSQGVVLGLIRAKPPVGPLMWVHTCYLVSCGQRQCPHSWKVGCVWSHPSIHRVLGHSRFSMTRCNASVLREPSTPSPSIHSRWKPHGGHNPVSLCYRLFQNLKKGKPFIFIPFVILIWLFLAEQYTFVG